MTSELVVVQVNYRKDSAYLLQNPYSNENNYHSQSDEDEKITLNNNTFFIYARYRQYAGS